MENNLEDIIAKGKISLLKIPEGPKYLLEHNDVKLLPLKHLVTLRGEKCQGKSQAVTVLMAAVLGNRTFGFRSTVKDSKVIYIDTYHGDGCDYKLIKRLKGLLKWPDSEYDKRFSAYDFAGVGLGKINLDLIEKIIEEEKPNLVVVDAAPDLVSDIFNDTEARACANHLRLLCDKHCCCMITILWEGMHDSLSDRLFDESSDDFLVEKDKQRNLETFHLIHEDSTNQTIGQVEWRLENNQIKPIPRKRTFNSFIKI